LETRTAAKGGGVIAPIIVDAALSTTISVSFTGRVHAKGKIADTQYRLISRESAYAG
jgi:hypothetical protein